MADYCSREIITNERIDTFQVLCPNQQSGRFERAILSVRGGEMLGYSAYKLTGGVAGRSAGRRSAESPAGRCRPPLVGVLAALATLAALAGAFGAVAVAHPSVDRTVTRPLGGVMPGTVDGVIPGTVDGGVSETVDKGKPEGSSWT